MGEREVVITGGSPWGMRLSGGKDFGSPLSVSKVSESIICSIDRVCVGIELYMFPNIVMFSESYHPQGNNLIHLCLSYCSHHPRCNDWQPMLPVALRRLTNPCFLYGPHPPLVYCHELIIYFGRNHLSFDASFLCNTTHPAEQTAPASQLCPCAG